MKIGSHHLNGKVVLAPMVGVTDRPFRILCRSHGAVLATSEMINSKTDYRYDKRTLRRLDHRGEPSPRSIQILGNEPEVMADCARFSVDLGADIIDINMGCPAKKVCKRAAGSALMGDMALSQAIFEAMVAAVDVPVTLKMRIGLTLNTVNALEMAHIAQEAGIQALAIHGRSRACFYQGKVHYDLIARVKQSVSIPVIANGDIDSAHKAKWVLDYTQADALMIGREAQKRPWLFKRIQHFLDSGILLEEPDQLFKKRLLLNHMRNLYAFYDEKIGVRVARKHVRWQIDTKNTDDMHFWVDFNKLICPNKQIDLVKSYF